MKRAQGGFSMIELMLALVVIGMLSVPVYYIYKQSAAQAKAENEITNVQGIAASIRRGNRTSSDYSSLNTAKVIQQKWGPEKMMSGTQLFNAWGGEVQVSGASGSFSITYLQVPQESCLDFAVGSAGGFTALTIGGTPVKAGGQFNKANAESACIAADTTSVVFTGS